MLTGHRKSGTTLLHSLFDGHSDVNVYPVDLSLLYAYYPRWTSRNYTTNQKKERIRLVITKSTSRIHGKKLSSGCISFDPDILSKLLLNQYCIEELTTPAHLIKAFSESYCLYAGLDTSLPFLFKETSQAVNLLPMLEQGLHISTIQIIRDPRDNYSAIKAGIDQYYALLGEGHLHSLCSLLFRANIDLDLAFQLCLSNSKHFRTIKYEELVDDPTPQLVTLCNFLNLDWYQSMLIPTFLGEPFTGNSFDSRSSTSISSVSVGRWRERITIEEQLIIEYYMYEVMGKWNYAVQVDLNVSAGAIMAIYAKINDRFFFSDPYQL